MNIKINNKQMRQLWLKATGLAANPTGSLNVLQMIKDLGFVQLDTIQNVSRAHHHILWSRNQNYREIMLDELLAKRQHVFEHFTHDASILPVEFYPMWRRQFRRRKASMDGSSYYKTKAGPKSRAEIKARIDAEGALSTHAFDSKIKGEKKMWDRPPHKVALDYMWHAGELSTSHRVNFRKYYDLTEKVIPAHILGQNLPDQHQIDWLCQAAMARLFVASVKEIKQFWEGVSLKEARAWGLDVSQNLQHVDIENYDGTWSQTYAAADILTQLDELKTPSTRMRIVNPFDPAVRDRVRLKYLFGFDYKIEIFVPAAKRKWGYYVYPLLEGDRFVGRIELKAERKLGKLHIVNLWHEDGVKWGDNRKAKLKSELERFAKYVGLQVI
ncbi:MAG: winged helix-turn-helix domain-containing protein [Rhizobiales bacterium]|nr:winged helix DNA-binding domain-containing protein [Hyphomicrobiales bacterium]NRB15631.1 winged helix-turn-helix domain-containing protein [Hyphomicrobiales bacterium]